jgi:O-glycosyl hydrolase
MINSRNFILGLFAAITGGIFADYVACRPGTAGDLSAAGSADLTVTVKLEDEKQTINAFGASDCWSIQFVGQWPQAKRNAIADLLFSQNLGPENNPQGISLSSWRFNLGAGSSRDTSRTTRIRDPWRRADTFLNETWDGYDWTRLPGQRWFLEAAKGRGVKSFTLFTNSPPVNLTKNGLAYCDASVGSSNLPENNCTAFAAYLCDVLAFFRDNTDITFDYVSPFNEPQWDWNGSSQEGCRYSNADIRRAVDALHAELQARKLDARIMVSEAGDITYLYSRASHPAGSQIEQLFGPASPHYIGDKVAPLITGHSYWTDTPAWGIVAKRQALRERLNQVPNLQYGMSEYCILGDGGSNTELSGNRRDLGMDSALRLARTIHYDLTLTDAVAWDWWLAVSPYNYKDGLIYCDNAISDGNYFESKMLWGMGHYSRFIRPGMKRVETLRSDKATPTDTLKGLMVSAYKSDADNKTVLVFVNCLDQPRTAELKVQTANQALFVTEWIPYLTGQTQNLSAHAALSTQTVRIPARSIVTLVGSFTPAPHSTY